jgi:CheY-like chemotaxis protein
MGIKNILLVDDDAAVNFLNKFLLTASNKDYDISVAVNGRDAIKSIIASSQCPDVIFLDINMPVMGGFDFLQIFQEYGKCNGHTQVYMLTSSIRQSDKDLAATFSCVKGYMEKPLSEESIKSLFSPEL